MAWLQFRTDNLRRVDRTRAKASDRSHRAKAANRKRAKRRDGAAAQAASAKGWRLVRACPWPPWHLQHCHYRPQGPRQRSVIEQSAVYREARGCRRPAGSAIDFAHAAVRILGCIDAVDEEARHAMVDQLALIHGWWQACAQSAATRKARLRPEAVGATLERNRRSLTAQGLGTFRVWPNAAMCASIISDPLRLSCSRCGSSGPLPGRSVTGGAGQPPTRRQRLVPSSAA